MYPTIIVILVNYENSKEEPYGISAIINSDGIVARDIEAPRAATIGNLSFAAPQSTIASLDNETFDRQVNGFDVEKSRTEGGDVHTEVEGHV